MNITISILFLKYKPMSNQKIYNSNIKCNFLEEWLIWLIWENSLPNCGKIEG